jgi:hypothetical protein
MRLSRRLLPGRLENKASQTTSANPTRRLAGHMASHMGYCSPDTLTGPGEGLAEGKGCPHTRVGRNVVQGWHSDYLREMVGTKSSILRGSTIIKKPILDVSFGSSSNVSKVEIEE